MTRNDLTKKTLETILKAVKRYFKETKGDKAFTPDKSFSLHGLYIVFIDKKQGNGWVAGININPNDLLVIARETMKKWVELSNKQVVYLA